MSKQLKFLQVSTLLRSEIDPEKVSHQRYDELLSGCDVHARDNLIKVVEAVLSGQIEIDLDKKAVFIDSMPYVPDPDPASKVPHLFVM